MRNDVGHRLGHGRRPDRSRQRFGFVRDDEPRSRQSHSETNSYNARDGDHARRRHHFRTAAFERYRRTLGIRIYRMDGTPLDSTIDAVSSRDIYDIAFPKNAIVTPKKRSLQRSRPQQARTGNRITNGKKKERDHETPPIQIESVPRRRRPRSQSAEQQRARTR